MAWFLENEPTAFELYEKLVGLYETDVMPEEFELACNWCLCGCNEKVKLRQSFQVALFSPKEKTCASWYKQRVATLLGPSPHSAPRTTPAGPPTPGPQPTAATPAVTPSPQKSKSFFSVSAMGQATIIILSAQTTSTNVSPVWGDLIDAADVFECASTLKTACVKMRKTLGITDGSMPLLEYVQIIKDLKEEHYP